MTNPNAHPPGQTCANCYSYANGDHNPGACKRYPPDLSGSFPSVRPSDWCALRTARSPIAPPAFLAVVVTDATGRAVLTFPEELESLPVVQATVQGADALPIMWNIEALTLESVTVRVWRGQLLPADTTPSSLLENYNVFGAAELGGVPVHITVTPVQEV